MVICEFCVEKRAFQKSGNEKIFPDGIKRDGDSLASIPVGITGRGSKEAQ